MTCMPDLAGYAFAFAAGVVVGIVLVAFGVRR